MMQNKILHLSKHTTNKQCTLDCKKTKMLKTSHCLKFLEALESIVPHQPFKAKTHSLSKHTSTHWIAQIGLQKHTH
jgi:hypothetical protein